MLAFDWLEQTDKIGFNILESLQEWLVQSYGARLFGNTFLNVVSNFSLEGGNWVVCLWHQPISKMGYFKCTFCSIFVPFRFYLVMTLIVPCLDLDNIYIYARFSWSLNLQTLVRQNLFFLILVPLRGGLCMRGHGLLSLDSSYTKFK